LLLFIITDKRELRGIHKWGGRCSERLRGKAKGEVLGHTRWIGGMGYLR